MRDLDELLRGVEGVPPESLLGGACEVTPAERPSANEMVKAVNYVFGTMKWDIVASSTRPLSLSLNADPLMKAHLSEHHFSGMAGRARTAIASLVARIIHRADESLLLPWTVVGEGWELDDTSSRETILAELKEDIRGRLTGIAKRQGYEGIWRWHRNIETACIQSAHDESDDAEDGGATVRQAMIWEAEE
jgi:hypothetical protein